VPLELQRCNCVHNRTDGKTDGPAAGPQAALPPALHLARRNGKTSLGGRRKLELRGTGSVEAVLVLAANLGAVFCGFQEGHIMTEGTEGYCLKCGVPVFCRGNDRANALNHPGTNQTSASAVPAVHCSGS